MTASPEEDALGRKRMTLGKRVELLERDRAQQSRVLTAIVDAGKTFTPEQIAQLRAVMREEFAGAGLRLDDAENQDEAREDFRFLRKLRLTWDGSTKKVGTSVLTAIIGVALIILGSGFWQWLNSAGK